METIKQQSFAKQSDDATSAEEKNKNLIKFAIEEVWNKGNYSVLDEIVSEDFVVRSLNPANEVRGMEGIRQFYDSLRNAFPDIKFTVKDQLTEGNKVATQWIAEGTHRGDFQGIPPTGKRFKVMATDIDIIKNGKIAECWASIDELGLLQQLGVLNNKENNEIENLQNAWNGIAEGYNKFVTDTEIWLANEALKLTGLKRGQYFLDVAAGCGGLSLPAARLGAKVLATDWSPEMIRLFETRVKKENLSDAVGKVMDGHHLELESNLVDIAASQFGVMLFPELPKALREMVRVTKPGGKILLIAYGSPEKIEFLHFFIKALLSVAPDFPGLPDDPSPLEFQIADPAILQQRLAEAGLKNIKVETVTENLAFDSGEQLWNWILYGNPIPQHIISELQLSPDQIEKVKEQLEMMIRERAGKNKYAILTDPVNIGIGTK
jgi:steroid delta-isomerase-like uncharacterized protein